MECIPWDILPRYSTSFGRNLRFHVRSVYCGPLLRQAVMRGHTLSGGCPVELCANILSTLIHVYRGCLLVGFLEGFLRAVGGFGIGRSPLFGTRVHDAARVELFDSFLFCL